MPLEVENKFAVADRAALERRLAEIGARQLRVESQRDFYLKHPQRDFQKTDEALRIRQTENDLLVTYKGPRAPAAIKIREEFELTMPRKIGIDNACALFERLGFQVLAPICKLRTMYACPARGRQVLICLDRVAELGEFVEIEMIAESDDVAEASAAVAFVAGQLDLTSPITASYLKMHMARDQTQFPWIGVEQPSR